MKNFKHIPFGTGAFVLMYLFFSQGLFAQTTVTYNANGTFVVPNGVTSLTVKAWGGGGGGGDCASAQAGGGGGAFTTKEVSVTPGQSFNVVVGAGGVSGSDGGNSTFNGNTVIAVGGKAPICTGPGQTYGLGGLASNCTPAGPVAQSGGNGAPKLSNVGGGGGGSAYETAPGGNGGAQPAGGFGTGDGGEGGQNTGPGANGGNGYVPGGGGGGKGNATAYSSGSGAHGQVIVSWVCPTYTAVLSGTTSICPSGCTDLTVTIDGVNSTNDYSVTYNDGTSDHTVTMTGTGTINVCPSATTTYTLVSVTDHYQCPATVSGDATVDVVGCDDNCLPEGIPDYARCGQNNDKLLICHYNQGKNKYETICISPDAWCAHQNHQGGQDHLGACTGGERDAVSSISATEVSCIPNPFNGQTSISFGLNGTENVSLRVFNNMGQLVETLISGSLEAGDHTFIFDGSSLSGGMYFFSLTTGKQVQTGKMLMVK